ncbi:MAG: hypothetical protein A4E57_02413 [Syntrophorhabdaceae bacterium PtaU1.Bin034]|jgi:hypothetical protein|nr:MAG: hypothetical protein A4E57_02413 [Syntrophorhabdaceae bacterium PtaU1.Bin034]
MIGLVRLLILVAILLFVGGWLNGDRIRQLGDAAGSDACYKVAEYADAINGEIDRFLGHIEGFAKERAEGWRKDISKPAEQRDSGFVIDLGQSNKPG